MMNLNQVVSNFCSQNTNLGQRVQRAVEYRDALTRGEINSGEYNELLQDLRRLENIQLSMEELDQQIAFDECLSALMSLPI